jgi:hypothetical protein
MTTRPKQVLSQAIGSVVCRVECRASRDRVYFSEESRAARAETASGRLND